MPPLDVESAARKQRITEGLRGRGLDQAFADEALWKDLQDEANSGDPNRLVTNDLLEVARQARAVRAEKPPLGLFFSTDDVILVPGFLGSELVDVKGNDGLIWIDPKLLAGAVLGTDKLLDLKLAPYKSGVPDADAAASRVTVRPNGAIPVLYSGLQFDLEVRRYSVQVFGFDWRKDIQESATVLAGLIRARASQRPRPLHIIAHSQGTVVARRALQLVGAELGLRLVNNVVLLGPATAGTFAAAFAIAGTNSLLETARQFGITPPAGFPAVLQSMTGLYQLLPWRTDPVDGSTTPDKTLQWVRDHTKDVLDKDSITNPAFWETGVDPDRLRDFFRWGRTVDASFLNDRTTIILGDKETAGGVKFEGGTLVEDPAFRTTSGDGTVPDSLAKITGVTRVFKARGAEHMMLPATLAVIAAVRDVLAGRAPQVERVMGLSQLSEHDIPYLAQPEPAEALPVPRPVPVEVSTTTPAPAPVPAPTGQAAPPTSPVPPAAGGPIPPPQSVQPGGDGKLEPPAWESRPVPPPPNRRLRVYSFDPLFATEIDTAGTEEITLELPWEFADADRLEPGPVGEYVEVVDFDPASDCFYPPVDLNHPHLLAQGGLPVSEGDPRFHQQMAYAVSMTTILRFETALGRVAFWAPNLKRDKTTGEVIPSKRHEDEYVRRLRIYPHALREANAYYHPDKKALLLGYFPAQGVVGQNLPGGMVFGSLSYDIIAHETTHALLDGLHRYFTEPSNPDVFAFHEAFADAVAMFQHFSHPEVLRHQIAVTHGDVRRESMLGLLAAQFGEATGKRRAMRQYLGKTDEDGKPVPPDPTAIHKVMESHDRGAILVAALFGAFTNIYEGRVKDLRRIASGGTGILPPGDVHPDLVNRMADEAAKSARHLLTMCIRALDYVPPVDITFGEYLRSLITADYDLVRDDDLRYRPSVISAFRDWGIYPGDVRSLSVDSLLWSPPEVALFPHAIDFFHQDRTDTSNPSAGAPAVCDCTRVDDWNRHTDRLKAYVQMRQRSAHFHEWLRENVTVERARFLGLALGKDAPLSIRRNKDGEPVFEVHSMRPCRRIGPDGQQEPNVVVEIVQRRKAFFNPNREKELGSDPIAWDKARQDFYFRGGCTLVIDPESGDVRHCVRKSILQENEKRLNDERRFRQGQFGDPSAGLYLSGPGSTNNPFCFLHGGR